MIEPLTVFVDMPTFAKAHEAADDYSNRKIEYWEYKRRLRELNFPVDAIEHASAIGVETNILVETPYEHFRRLTLLKASNVL